MRLDIEQISVGNVFKGLESRILRKRRKKRIEFVQVGILFAEKRKKGTHKEDKEAQFASSEGTVSTELNETSLTHHPPNHRNKNDHQKKESVVKFAQKEREEDVTVGRDEEEAQEMWELSLFGCIRDIGSGVR